MKTLLVYSHLLAACFALGVLLLQDLALTKLRGQAMHPNDISYLKTNTNYVSYTLVVLWVSGLALVTHGYLDNPNYLLNQKLWAKFAVVITLTLNGVILHYYSFPKLMEPQGFWSNSTHQQIAVLITAVISLVSWLFACYLGIARTWNNTVSFGYVMSFYLGALIIGSTVAFEAWRALRKPFHKRPIEA
jgi:hypothetical protein